MKLARIVRMGPAKLADRLRQEERRWLERLQVVGSGQLSTGEIVSSFARGPLASGRYAQAGTAELEVAAQRLLAHFRATAPARFFPGVCDPGTAQLIAERMPDARAAVLRAAAKSRAGRFDLLGYSDLDFGDPIDWHFEPVSGKKLELAHWTQIDPLDRSRVGDHKVVWELNRHQWLVHWAEAYAFTGDESYAERCVEMLERWLRANPPGRGINWASSLELALRLISWCFCLVLLRDSPALPPLTFVRLLGAIHTHATHITRHLSTTFSPNTHLLGEALGLFYVGVLFAEADRAPRWRELARTILTDEISRQVKRDGVYFEQATCYQRYTTEIYLQFLILAERNAVEIPASVVERVHACLDFLVAIRRDDGSVPQIGDGDGGWLLPLEPRAADDMRGVFATGAALLDRPDCANAAGGPALELAWLLGRNGIAAFDTRSSVAAQGVSSRLFKDGGYAVMRSGRGADAHQLILDVGPLGCPNSGGHGHADLLAVSCDIFGEPCIVDPGMPHYGGDPEWRDAFRSSALHSTVTIDRRSQATPNGPFAWQRRPAAQLIAWTSSGSYDVAAGEHDAYRTRWKPLTHRRRVIFMKPRYFVIIDELLTENDPVAHHVELCFQFAPRVRLQLESAWVRAITPCGHALLVRTSAEIPFAAAIHEGERPPLPIRGWFSPAYGQLEPAPLLTLAATARLPLRVFTTLLPLRDAQQPAPDEFPPAGDRALLQRLSE